MVMNGRPGHKTFNDPKWRSRNGVDPEEQRDAILGEMRKALDRNRGVAEKMGVNDPAGEAPAEAALAAAGGGRRGISLSPRSFLAGSNPGGRERPASNFRESAAGKRPTSVSGVWGAPVNSAQFDNPVTGLASGSLLGMWGGDGKLGSKAGAKGRSGAGTGTAWAGAGDSAGAGDIFEIPKRGTEAPGYDPSLTGDDYAGARGPSGPNIGPRVANLEPVDTREVGSLLRDSSTYGSLAQEDFLDASNSLARLRIRMWPTGGV